MSKLSQAEKLQKCAEFVREAKAAQPKAYEIIHSMLFNRANQEGKDILETAIDFCMENKNDTVMHLWYMGVATIMIEEEVNNKNQS